MATATTRAIGWSMPKLCRPHWTDCRRASLPPDRLLELLFDEVEELQQTIDERDTTIAQLTALMERQGNALERAVSIAEDRGDRSSSDQVQALSATSDRALRLLEDAMDRLSGNEHSIQQLSQLVERGVATSEQFDAQLQRHQDHIEEKQAVIEQQGRMIDRLFSLSDKVLGIAGLSSRRDGLLRRFFNRSRGGQMTSTDDLIKAYERRLSELEARLATMESQTGLAPMPAATPRAAGRSKITGLSLGVDVGGTFTDLLLLDERKQRTFTAKVPSTPEDSSRGVLNGIEKICAEAGIDPADIGGVMHGTTVATNTVLTGSGAKVGLVTSKGYRETLQIARSLCARRRSAAG